MKVLIHRYNSICEPDYIEAFKSLNIEVIEDTAEMTDKSIPIERKVETLAEEILTHQPMFVFSINFFPYISMVCEKLGAIYVCVSVDCPVPELFNEQIRNKCNRIFLFDYMQYMDIVDENPECIFHLPLGVNVDRINDTIGAPDWEMVSKEYKYDVSFIGSLYNEKNPFPTMYEKLEDRYKGMCDALFAAQELMSGQELIEKAVTLELVEAIKNAAEDFYPSDASVRNIDSFVAVNSYLSTELTVRDRLMILGGIGQISDDLNVFTRSETRDLASISGGIKFHGGVKSLTEMPLVFRQSKINLNPTMRPIRSGLSQRVWDILGAGGFCLTNYQAELPEYMEIGTHIAAYETVDEACELVRYYLENAEERMEITKAGYELAKEKHTVMLRVVEMIRIIAG